MKWKRLLSAVLSAVVVMNTMAEPLTTMAMGTDTTKSETKAETGKEFDQQMDELLKADNFYAAYEKVESRKDFVKSLSDQEAYELKLYAKYGLVDEFSKLGKNPQKAEADKAVEYTKLYAEIPVKNLDDTADVEQKALKKLSAKEGKEFGSYDSYHEYLQTILPFDLNEFFHQLDSFTSVDTEALADTVIKFRNYVYATYGFDSQESKKSGESIFKSEKEYLQADFYGRLEILEDEGKYSTLIDNLTPDEAYEMFLYGKYALLNDIMSISTYASEHKERVDVTASYVSYFADVAKKAKETNTSNKENVEKEYLAYRSTLAEKKYSGFAEYHKDLKTSTEIDVDKILNKLDAFLNAEDFIKASNEMREYVYSMFGLKQSAFRNKAQVDSGTVYDPNNQNTWLPAGYNFRPTFKAGTTTVSRTNNTGFKYNSNVSENSDTYPAWHQYDGKYYVAWERGYDGWYKPNANDNGDLVITYKNVGTYNGQTVNMRMTYETFGGNSSNKHKGMGYGYNCVAYGWPNFNKGISSERYSIMKFEFTNSAGKLINDIKGYIPLNDIDYIKGAETMELLSGTKGFYVDSTNNKKVTISGNTIKANSGTGGGDSNDGANAVYLFNGATHKVKWTGALMNFNEQKMNVQVKPTVKIQFNANGGTIAASDPTYTLDNDGYVCKKSDGTRYTVTVGLDEIVGSNGNGLADPDNPNALNITRKGYHYIQNKGWKTTKGYKGPGKIFDEHYGSYTGSSFGKAGQTITLYANLTPDRHNVQFDTQGGNINKVEVDGYMMPDSGWYRLKSALNTYIHVRDMDRENGTTGTDASKSQYVAWNPAHETVGDDNNALYYLERYKDTQYYFIINCRSGKYMQMDGKESTGTLKAKTYPYQWNMELKSNGEPEGDFLWSFKKVGNYVSIINKGSGLALDVYDAATANGTPIWMYTPNGTNAQQFTLVPHPTYTNPNFHTKYKVYGVTFNVPWTIPHKAGYEFMGWNTAADGSGTSYAPGANYTHDQNGGNVKLYAQWKKNTNTVTYLPNGGTGSTTTQEIEQNKSWTTKGATYTKAGYTQTSWNTATNGTGTKYSLSTSQTGRASDLTLYAQYTPNTYKVVYNGNGATSGSTATSNHTYDTAKNLTANGFNKTGYTFAGWATSPTGNVVYSNTQSVKNLTSTNGGTINLYAKWTPITYKIVYNGNGATGGSTATSTHTYDVAKNLTANGFAKTGYTFSGWNTKADGSGIAYTNQQSVKNLTSVPNGTVTLYAQWKINTYTNTISHWAGGFKNSEGNNGAKNMFKLGDTSFTANYNSSFVMDTQRKTTIPNGFYLNPKFGTSAITGSWGNYAMGTSVTQKPNNMKFEYDYFPTDYKITYDLGGGTNNSANPSSYNVLYGVSLKNPTRTGYTFAGWYNGSTKVTGINEGKNATFASASAMYTELAKRTTGNITLTAKWTPNTYKVVYNGNGSTGGSTATSTHTFDVAKNLTANGFVKTGYTFSGWATSASGAVVYKNSQSVKNLTSVNGGSVNLYAKWTPNKYTVSYNANGGTGSMATDTATYDANYTTKANTFTRTGYTFVGWNEKPDGSGADWTSWIGKPWKWTYTKNITLYAQWKANAYTVKYNGNGATGGSTASSSHVYDVAKNLTKNGFTKTGYLFAGWSTSASGAVAYKDAQSVKNLTSVNGGTVNLYAKWTPIKYTITYNGNGSTSGTMKPSTHTYDTSSNLTPNGFKKVDFEFVGWNTKPDGTGTSYKDQQSVKNLSSTNGANLTFYAQWKPTKVVVIYDGNSGTGASGNKELLENVPYDKSENYLVRKNASDIRFSKKQSTFEGWGLTSRDKYNTPGLMRDSQDYRVNLKQIAQDQGEAAKNAKARRSGFFSVGDNIATVGVTETGVPEVTFYATWDAVPVINGTDAVKEFYEGTTVTRADLLKGISATDPEDPNVDLTSQIKIKKIEYAAGRMVGGVAQKAYVEEWPNGMPADAKLDTWFMELDKEKSPAVHKVTFEVKDPAGHVVTATQTVKVKYNEFPTITAQDRYFTLDEAQNGVITKKLLLDDAIGSDDRTADVYANDAEEKQTVNNTAHISLVDFNADEFKNFTESGYRKLTFKVQDTYGPSGKGKEAYCQMTVYVIKDGEIPEVEKAKEVRFISEKYYNLNKDLNPDSMTDAQKEKANDNGGLNVDSKWYKDPAYKALIESTFGKTTGDHYQYELEDLDKMRDFVEEHGVGNAQEADGLSKFADQFMTGKYKK